MEQSKLLDHIGSAQMERELQGNILTLAKKASNIMEEETGVEAPMTEGKKDEGLHGISYQRDESK